jgi:predicted nucleic acid-binding protein
VLEPLDLTARLAALVPPPRTHLTQTSWLPRLRQLCVEKQLKGNSMPDASLAAATIHLGEHLVSFDRDFRKLVGRSQFTLLEADPR